MDENLTTVEVVKKRIAGRLRHWAWKLSPLPDPRPDNPWGYVDEIRERLTDDEQWQLGCGLLSTADVTIEVKRGGRTMYVNPSMDPITLSVIKTGGYSDDEIARVDRYLRPISS